MSTSQIQENIYHTLFPQRLGAAEKRKLKIIEAAIKTYCRLGFAKTRVGDIAKTAKVSRPLILHHFGDEEALFQFVIKYIRANLQLFAIQEIEKGETLPEKLKLYLQSTIRWLEEYPEHMKVWLYFFHRCSVHKKDLTMHSDLVSMGHERIQQMIQLGIESDDFQCDDPALAAKMIQMNITGTLVCMVTEKNPFSNQAMEEQLLRNCFAFLSAKVP